jgi:hypothetical protein
MRLRLITNFLQTIHQADSTGLDSNQIDARALLGERETVSRTGGRSMVRELQIMAVGLVFLFLGAIVVGVF